MVEDDDIMEMDIKWDTFICDFCDEQYRDEDGKFSYSELSQSGFTHRYTLCKDCLIGLQAEEKRRQEMHSIVLKACARGYNEIN